MSLFLTIHVLQHPDAPLNLCDREHETTFTNGDVQRSSFKPQHLALALVRCDLKRLPYRFAACRIEVNSPNVGIPQAFGDKVKYLAIRRPVRLVIPAFLLGDARPLT